jgi:hypothetical protein
MNWIDLEEISPQLPIPHSYRVEQLKRSDIPEVVSCLKTWFPDISVGAVSRYLQEDFYAREVFFAGEPEKEVMVALVRRDQELAAMLSLERDQNTLTLYGAVGAVAPKHRGHKLANLAPALLEAIGRAMGMGLVYYFGTLKVPHMQAAAEAAGFQIVGILPSDRQMVAPGVVKYVYEAIYAKVLAASTDVLRPQSECLTPRTKALFDLLFAA